MGKNAFVCRYLRFPIGLFIRLSVCCALKISKKTDHNLINNIIIQSLLKNVMELFWHQYLAHTTYKLISVEVCTVQDIDILTLEILTKPHTHRIRSKH